MYDRMVHEHGYSIRKLAEKLGKDKGYLENRLRLAGAPPEIRELVSLRKDSLSHAYELMKVEDPKKRRRLTDQVARGELTLIKLREKIDGRPAREPRRRRARRDGVEVDVLIVETVDVETRGEAGTPTSAAAHRSPLTDDSLVNAKQRLTDAVEDLVDVLRSTDIRGVDPGDGSGEPREVPDDHEAQARERDRARPQRGQSSRRRGRQGGPSSQTSPARADPDGLELPRPLAPGRRRSSRPTTDAEPDDDPGSRSGRDQRRGGAGRREGADRGDDHGQDQPAARPPRPAPARG